MEMIRGIRLHYAKIIDSKYSTRRFHLKHYNCEDEAVGNDI